MIAADREGTLWIFSMRDKRDCKAAEVSQQGENDRWSIAFPLEPHVPP